MVDIRELKQPTINLKDPQYTEGITLVGRQEEVIRQHLADKNIKTLRGFHWYLKRKNWSYYDILEEAYL